MEAQVMTPSTKYGVQRVEFLSLANSKSNNPVVKGAKTTISATSNANVLQCKWPKFHKVLIHNFTLLWCKIL